jgi:hypothetical protein
MTGVPQTAMALHPRWDGRRILFEVMDAEHAIPCAISLNALQDLSTQRRFKPADLLASFAVVGPRIAAIALHKYRSRAEVPSGVLNIWSDDVEGPNA